VRATPEEYERLELRAHSLLAGVPLHDVWAVDLVGRGPGRTIADVRTLLSVEALTETNRAVRLLFGLRRWLGRHFGWDGDSPPTAGGSFLERLTEADRANTLVAPGTPEGPFRVLFVSPREAISEALNRTVHAFSVLALVERPASYRLYWAIHVQPVGWVTRWYMRLIDPFRRFVIYPAVLRRVSRSWKAAS